MNKKIISLLLAAFSAETAMNASETVFYDQTVHAYRHIPTGRIVSDNIANVALESYAKAVDKAANAKQALNAMAMEKENASRLLSFNKTGVLVGEGSLDQSAKQIGLAQRAYNKAVQVTLQTFGIPESIKTKTVLQPIAPFQSLVPQGPLSYACQGGALVTQEDAKLFKNARKVAANLKAVAHEQLVRIPAAKEAGKTVHLDRFLSRIAPMAQDAAQVVADNAAHAKAWAETTIPKALVPYVKPVLQTPDVIALPAMAPSTEKAFFAAKNALYRSRFIKGVGAAIAIKTAILGAFIKGYYDQLTPNAVVDPVIDPVIDNGLLTSIIEKLKNNKTMVAACSALGAGAAGLITYKVVAHRKAEAQKQAEEAAQKLAEEAKIEAEKLAKIEAEKSVRNVLSCKKATSCKKKIIRRRR